MLTLAWLDPELTGAAWAASWRPELTVGTRYDDNPFMLGHERAGSVTMIAPEIGYVRPGRTVSLEALARRNYDLFSEGSLPVRQTDRIQAHASHARSERDVASLDYRLVRSDDPAETGAGVLSPGKTTQWQGSAGLTLSRVEASLRASRWIYDRPDLADGGSRAGAITLLPLSTAEGALTLTCRRTELGEPGSLVLATTTALVGMRRSHTRGVSSEAGIGATRVSDAQHPSPVRRLALLAGLAVTTEAFGHMLTARLSAQHEATTTGSAEVTQSFGPKALSVIGERRLDVEGGVYHDATTSSRVAFTATDTLWRVNVAKIEGAWNRTQPYLDRGSDTHLYGMSMTLARSVQPWLVAGASYQYQRQETAGQPSHAVRRNRIGVSLTMQMP